ncbi:probable GPI-anchored adhesin-like protein PGA55 isoform X2 [Nicotiana sylvestris]|uniref:Flocculation protein FLO11-like isoform X2 n=1 Tax=Nicotiana sylvestris TaxID=4096 RepID=A0A1U7VRI0_NICSY|nr:PREDICTED: flocculation protein FLO11-like isoform X2 [Nicotiana sylvestris]
MAPRGRPRKRLSRMDAAVDAMTPFGFDESLVRKTVNKLLKEYEGDEGWEGWAFIEDCGYKELIDAFLRDQEVDHGEERQTQTQKGVSSQDESAEDPASESTIAPSGTLVVSTCYEAGNTVGETACTELVNAVEEPTYEELCSNKQDIGSTEVFCPPSAERDGNRWTDIGEDQTLTQKGSANAVFSNNGENPRSNSHVTSPPPTTSACPVNRLKMSSWSQVQSQSTSHVSTPPPASSSSPVVNRFKMSFGSQVKSRSTPCVSTPPLTSSSCPVNRLKINSGSQVESRSTPHVSTPPPTSSSSPVNRLKMTSVSQVKSRSNSHVSAPPPTSPSSPISADHRTKTLPSSKPVSVPPRKRVPCYGWIGNDDEEDADDFIQLPPMKPTTSQNSSGGTNKQMKRKSRWDIRPNDP